MKKFLLFLTLLGCGNSGTTNLSSDNAMLQRASNNQSKNNLSAAEEEDNVDFSALSVEERNNKLIELSKEGKDKQVEQIMTLDGIDLTVANADKETALSVAVNNDQAKVLKILLASDYMDKAIKENSQLVYNLLKLAQKQECVKTFEVLVKDVRINLTTNIILELVCTAYDYRVYKTMPILSEACQKIDLTCSDNEKFIIYVTLNYKNKVVDMLSHIDDAVINSQGDEIYFSPLYVVAIMDNQELLEVILDKDNLQLDINTSKDLLDYALRYSGDELVLFILYNKVVQQPFGSLEEFFSKAATYATDLGRKSIQEKLLDNGAVVCIEDACSGYVRNKEEHFQCFKVILEKAGPNVASDHKSPLANAAKHGHVECLELLLKHKNMDLNQDNQGERALWHAAAKGHAGCVQLLLDANVNPNIVDDEGLSPILLAACGNHLMVFNILLLACDWNKGEAQAVANTLVDQGSMEYLRSLLKHLLKQLSPEAYGNFIKVMYKEAKEEGKKKIFDLSIWLGNIDIVSMCIEDLGVNIVLLDAFIKVTPLLKAAFTNKEEVIELILDNNNLDLEIYNQGIWALFIMFLKLDDPDEKDSTIGRFLSKGAKLIIRDDVEQNLIGVYNANNESGNCDGAEKVQEFKLKIEEIKNKLK